MARYRLFGQDSEINVGRRVLRAGDDGVFDVADGSADEATLIAAGAVPAVGQTAAQAAAMQAAVSGAWTSDNSGAWASVRSVTMRLRMTGTGTVTMDSRNAAGTITLAVYTATVSGSTLVEYAYPGDDADSIRVALTGTATAEVI